MQNLDRPVGDSNQQSRVKEMLGASKINVLICVMMCLPFDSEGSWLCCNKVELYSTTNMIECTYCKSKYMYVTFIDPLKNTAHALPYSI